MFEQLVMVPGAAFAAVCLMGIVYIAAEDTMHRRRRRAIRVASPDAPGGRDRRRADPRPSRSRIE